MFRGKTKDQAWDFYSILIISAYCILQVLRWPVFPQFIDIYYHFLTAWGFIQAGGYSGWDFWQYAPVGRPHIYPPIFHIILSLFIKSGINKIILAKFLEVIIPIIFLIVLWHFIRKNYGQRLSFFMMLTVSSSFSFYLSLLNNIPATLAIILGFLAFDRFFKGQYLRSTILLTTSFYTHIGIPWVFALSIILCGLFNKGYGKTTIRIFLSTIILSTPILFKEWQGLKFISLLGMPEKYLSEFKTVEYLLALFGLWLVFKKPRIYRLFSSLFFSSFIFLAYPYRFFSAQGYLPIILLSAVALDNIYEKLKDKKAYSRSLIFFLGCFILLISPTVLMEKYEKENRINYKMYLWDSAFVDMILPLRNSRMASTSLWHPAQYLAAADTIKSNSQEGDIVYSNSHIVGVSLASISERPTANALFPEIGASKEFNPVSVSKIVILTKDYDKNQLGFFMNKYNLIKIDENKLFILYKNPYCHNKFAIKKSSLPFQVILFIGLTVIFLFWRQKIC